ncbi:hypothetical protein [Synechococcus sp. CCAP 1479/9]|uniref:hypothetical protein n=1 Tax=Synechococcus sp. CCAP 1479/9 TaxID=1221593 RepID=UPI001C242289|nr:hypothetical protein [Synechococcus sp. CCAP 1479/9]
MPLAAIAPATLPKTTDTVIDAICAGTIGFGNISYSLLRRVAGRDYGCWDELGRGRAILTSPEQLDQYLYTYGPMTKDQWDQVLPRVRIPPGRLRIVDYGCGQGLASGMLIDFFGTELAKRISNVVLVDPSGVALARAEAVLRCYTESAKIWSLNKRLDDLIVEDLILNGEAYSIHLFSNVLDIDSFQHIELFNKILKTKGRHLVLAVSHNRNFHGGSSRLYEIAQALNDYAQRGRLSLLESTIREFRCPKGQKAISLQLRLEVLHGSV